MKSIDDLIKVYAEYNEMSFNEAERRYETRLIDNYSLLQAYLSNEGIFGYAQTIYNIFEILNDL